MQTYRHVRAQSAVSGMVAGHDFLCLDMCVGIDMDMCVDLWIGMCGSRHVYRKACMSTTN